MPVSFQIIPELNLVHIVYSGRVTIQELWAESTDCYQQPSYQRGMSEVSDLTQVTEVDIGFDEMMDYTQQSLDAHMGLDHPIDICLVGNSDVTGPAVAMYENLAAARNVNVRVHQLQGYPEVLATLNLTPENLALFPAFCRRESHLF